jgi:hypothetical protein
MRAIPIILAVSYILTAKAQKIPTEILFSMQQKGSDASEIFLLKNGWVYSNNKDNTKPESYYDYKKKARVTIKKDSSELNYQTLWKWGNEFYSNPYTLNIIQTLKGDNIVEIETNKEIFLNRKREIKDLNFSFLKNEVYHNALSSIYSKDNLEVEFMMEHFTEFDDNNPTQGRFLYTKYIIRIYPAKLSKYYSGGIQKEYKKILSAK